ncbi:MAG: hypothetical protein AAFU53_02520, partial [Cyanobacteria bacterium J06632_3]
HRRASRLSLCGLLCVLSLGTTSCFNLLAKVDDSFLETNGSGSDQDYYEYAENKKAAFEVSERTISFQHSAAGITQLNVGVHSDSESVEIKTTDAPTIAIEYFLIAKQGDEENKLESIEVASGQKADLLVATLPRINGCSRASINGVMRHLNGTCETKVVLTLPKASNIKVLVTDFYDTIDEVGADSIFHDLVWPSRVPTSVSSLVNMLPEIEEDKHRPLLVERYVEAGHASGITAADCIAIVNVLEESWVQRSTIQLLAAPLKVTYGNTETLINELKPALEPLDVTDYEKAVESLESL